MLAGHEARRAVWPKTVGDNRLASNILKEHLIHGHYGIPFAR